MSEPSIYTGREGTRGYETHEPSHIGRLLLMPDLRRASTEAHLRPIRRDIDAAVAALPWHVRLIYRAVLPIARIIYRVRRTP